MTSNDSQQLTALLETLAEGISFYERAADAATLPEHKRIFERMLRSRNFAAVYLSAFLQKDVAHTFGNVLTKMYPDILFGLNKQFDTDLIEQSHQTELNTLKAMQATLSTIESPTLRSALIDLYPQLNGNHVHRWNLDIAS